MEMLKVSSKSNPNSVAGAIASLIKENKKVEMQAIGAGALNQAIKAVAIARGFVAPWGADLVCVPAFTEVDVEGEDRTRNENNCNGGKISMKCIQKSREYMCLQYMPSSPKFWAKLGELLPNQLYQIDESCYDLRLELKINDNFIKVRKGDYILIDKDECINILSKEKFERDYCIIKESEGKENG